jgi:hypothetical protein
MSSNDIHDFIFFTLLHGRKENNRTGSHYYNYKDKQYLVAGSHLISRRKLDKLKGLLFDRMDIKDAYLTLHKHDIPESCRYELIHKLGFWVSTNSEYSSGGYIVRHLIGILLNLQPCRSCNEILFIYLYAAINS